MGRLPAPKNIIADPKTGVVTPEWLDWLQTLADEATSTITPPAPAPPPTEEAGDSGPVVGGGGGLTIVNNYGSGTPGKITKWVGQQLLGDSIISEQGNAVVIVQGDLIADSFTGALPKHAPTHQLGGADPLPLDALAPPRDTGDLNASTSSHGLLPKLSGDATQYLNGVGVWMPVTADGGGGGGGTTAEEEVFVGPEDPIDTGDFDLWYDTDAIPAGGGPPGILKVRVDGAWQDVYVAPGGGGPGGMNLDYLGPFAPGPVYNDGDIVIAEDGVAYLCVIDGTTTPPEPWPGVGMITSVGPPGPPGPKGDKGDQGPAGSSGAPDASYWVAVTHPDLTNARVLSSLANGYVKSTAGEPSTVAVIPLADGGTGATDAPTARTNLGLGSMATQNANAVAISGGTISGSHFGDGSGLTNLNASNITTGTLAAAQLPPYIAYTNVNNYFVAQQFGSFSTVAGDYSLLMFHDTAAPVNQKCWRMLNYHNGNLYFEALTDGFASLIKQAMVLTPLGQVLATSFHGDGSALTGIIPAGTIVMRMSACPPGWTRIVWDGYFLRVGPTPGASGGAWEHAHGVGTLTVPAHSHGAGTYATSSHNHGGSVSVSLSISGSTNSTGSHSHTWSDSVNANTGGESAGIMGVDAGGSGNMTRGPHTHNYIFTVSGTTSTDGSHSHTVSGSGSGSGTIANNTGLDVNGTSAASVAVAVTGATGPAQHLPPFIDVFLCQKD